jgi:hypothetical protein
MNTNNWLKYTVDYECKLVELNGNPYFIAKNGIRSEDQYPEGLTIDHYADFQSLDNANDDEKRLAFNALQNQGPVNVKYGLESERSAVLEIPEKVDFKTFVYKVGLHGCIATAERNYIETRDSFDDRDAESVKENYIRYYHGTDPIPESMVAEPDINKINNLLNERQFKTLITRIWKFSDELRGRTLSKNSLNYRIEKTLHAASGFNSAAVKKLYTEENVKLIIAELQRVYKYDITSPRPIRFVKNLGVRFGDKFPILSKYVKTHLIKATGYYKGK